MKHGMRLTQALHQSSADGARALGMVAENEETDLTPEILQSLNDKLGGRTAVRKNWNIPAGYTYLAQFVAHDLGFHSFSEAALNRDDSPGNLVCKPHLDLSSLYGSGPEAAPERYVHKPDSLRRWRLKLGENRTTAPMRVRLVKAVQSTVDCPDDVSDLAGEDTVGQAVYEFHPHRGLENDLPRCPLRFLEVGRAQDYDGTALIADPRNDENLILSQLTVLLCRLHNKIGERIEEIGDRGESRIDGHGVFAVARQMTVYCYQQVIAYDLLKRLLDERVYEQLIAHINEPPDSIEGLLTPGARAMIQRGSDAPKEFWTAAFRFGHVMVQNHYDISEKHPRSRVREIIELMETGKYDGPPIKEEWVIDWERFFFTTPDDETLGRAMADNEGPKLNFSHPISLEFADQLTDNTIPRFKDKRGFGGLAALDLSRMVELSGTTAQSYIKSLKCDNGPKLMTPSELEQACARIKCVYPSFNRLLTETPIFIYVLAESSFRHQGVRLGPLGSLIVGEVIMAAIRLCRQTQSGHDWDRYFYRGAPSDMSAVLQFLDE